MRDLILMAWEAAAVLVNVTAVYLTIDNVSTF